MTRPDALREGDAEKPSRTDSLKDWKGEIARKVQQSFQSLQNFFRGRQFDTGDAGKQMLDGFQLTDDTQRAKSHKAGDAPKATYDEAPVPKATGERPVPKATYDEAPVPKATGERPVPRATHDGAPAPKATYDEAPKATPDVDRVKPEAPSAPQGTWKEGDPPPPATPR